MKSKKDRTKMRKVLALGMAGLLLAPQAALAGETRTYTGDVTQLRTIGGYSGSFGPSDLTSVIGNTLIIDDSSGGTALKNVFGTYIIAADVSGNTVFLRKGTIGGYIVGGWSAGGAAMNNRVTISGGSVEANAYGGHSQGVGAAMNNSVTITGGNVSGSVIGGTSDGGDAVNNSVTITGGSVGSSVIGGVSDHGDAVNNTVTISGNPTLTNTLIRGGISGGGADMWTGNTLNVRNSGMSAKEVVSFQYYNFYLPAALSAGGVMLTVNDIANITGSTIGVGFLSNTSLHPVSLPTASMPGPVHWSASPGYTT